MPSYWERLSQNKIATTLINFGLNAVSNYLTNRINEVLGGNALSTYTPTSNMSGSTVLDSQNGLSHNVTTPKAMSNWEMTEYEYGMYTKDNIFSISSKYVSTKEGNIQLSGAFIDDSVGVNRYTTDLSMAIDTESVYSDFNRFRQVFPREELETMRQYVFFVKPDLNILQSGNPNYLCNNVLNDPTFRYLHGENPGLLRYLCNYTFTNNPSAGTGHDFIPFLVGRTNSYQVSDFQLAQYEDAQLFTGFKYIYPGNANASLSGVSFDIEFREDRDLHITKFFYAWAYYIDGLIKGNFLPRDQYIGSKIADYMTSVYYIVTGPDGSEIKFFNKVVGAFPVQVPLSNWGFTGPTSQPPNTVTISFAGSTPEALNPTILTEFNQNAGLLKMKDNSGVMANMPSNPGSNSWYKNHFVPTYDQISGQVTFLTGKPFIIRGTTKKTAAGVTYGMPKKYYLVWADRNT